MPKKGGAGGKGVWGKPGSELLEDIEDVNDPNFDSELDGADIELKVVVPELSSEDLKKKVGWFCQCLKDIKKWILRSASQ